MRTKPIHKSTTCPICKCTVIVWKRKGFTAKFLRALAMADHVKTLHEERGD